LANRKSAKLDGKLEGKMCPQSSWAIDPSEFKRPVLSLKADEDADDDFMGKYRFEFDNCMTGLTASYEHLEEELQRLDTQNSKLQAEVVRLEKSSRRQPLKPSGDNDNIDVDQSQSSGTDLRKEDCMVKLESTHPDGNQLAGTGRSPAEILEEYNTLRVDSLGKRSTLRAAISTRLSASAEDTDDTAMTLLRRCFTCLHTPHLRLQRLEQFKDSIYFSTVVSLAIVTNLLFILAESDVKVQWAFSESAPSFERAVSNEPSWISAGNIFFFIFFAIELLIRILAEEGQFLFGMERRWNALDSSLVLLAATELLLRFGKVNPDMLRWMRILRLSRSARVLRVFKIFRELRMLLGALINILMPLMWSAVLLLVLILLFSIVFTYAAFTYAQDKEYFSSDHGEVHYGETKLALETYFGSVSVASLSLFMSLTSGDNWGNMIKPLTKVSIVYAIVFIVFLVFLQLGVLNVVTSIFVSAATTFAEHDTEMVQGSEAERQQTLTNRLNTFFDVYDTDGSGELSYQEFERFSKDRAVKAFFEKVLGIQTWKIKRLFRMLDADGDQSLGKQEFIVGCLQMTGPAKNFDLEALRQLCQMIRRDVCDLSSRVDSKRQPTVRGDVNTTAI